jgi:hypothetical protein
VLDWESYIDARKLFKDLDRPVLLDINKREMDNLHKRWTDPEFPIKIMDYMSKMKTKPKL